MSDFWCQRVVFQKRMNLDHHPMRSRVYFHLLNLYERPDRLEQSLSQLNSIEFSLDRAIEPVIKIHQQRRRHDGNGKLGCFVGHRKIWQEIASCDDFLEEDLHIICEDDISVDPDNFQNAVRVAFDESNRWDIYCFGWFPLSTRRDAQNDNLRRIRFGGMAHCYSVSRKWARVHKNAEYPGYNHDLWMFMDKKDGWNVVGYVPMVAFQSDQEQNFIAGQTPISDISPRMYQTRSLWWKLCPLEKTLTLSEKSNYFVWFLIFLIVIVLLLLVRKRRQENHS